MSTVPDVMRELRDRLRQRPNVQALSALVEVGLPTQPLGNRPAITIGGQDEPVVEEASDEGGPGMGAGRRTEIYTLRVYCSALRGDTGQLEAIEVADALRDEVAALLAEDRTLGLQPLALSGKGAEIAGYTLTIHGPETEVAGRWAELASNVRVTARI